MKKNIFRIYYGFLGKRVVAWYPSLAKKVKHEKKRPECSGIFVFGPPRARISQTQPKGAGIDLVFVLNLRGNLFKSDGRNSFTFFNASTRVLTKSLYIIFATYTPRVSHDL